MKDIEQALKQFRDWFPFGEQSGQYDNTGSLTTDRWIEKTLIKQHNSLLENQALALEGKQTPKMIKMGDGREMRDSMAIIRNGVLQQAADHLRAQKITE